MKPKMGPVLGFRGQDKDKGIWKVSALIVTDEDPRMLTYSVDGGQQTEADGRTKLLEHGEMTVWRFDMEISQGTDPVTVQYMFAEADQKWEFEVPGKKQPPNIAYASCNGFSDPKYMKTVRNRNILWKEMHEKHTSGGKDDLGPFHLLILGGDQVYADSIWQEKECKPMYDWVNLDWDARTESEFTPEMRDEVEAFYFRLYCDRWNQDDPKEMFRTVPTLMMWDDHDIFDGWGSYPDDMQNSEVYQGIFEIARKHFVAFQLQEGGDAYPDCYLRRDGRNFTYVHRVGDFAIAALDMRSERSNDQVMSRESNDVLYKWFAGLKKKNGIHHLLVMSSIPVVHLDFSRLEKVLNWIPGQQELEDDLRDHWHSVPHKEERIDLIKKLLKVGTNGVRVSFLSGDVHVAAVGAVENHRNDMAGGNANVINQLTCSAIVHPPPSAIVVWAMNMLMEDSEEIDRDIHARILKFRGTDFGLVGRRNWMSLKMQEDHSFIAHWHMERTKKSSEDPFTFSKIVNAC